jgi:hypothetical protein
MKELGRKGGLSRAARMTAKQRVELSRKGGLALGAKRRALALARKRQAQRKEAK